MRSRRLGGSRQVVWGRAGGHFYLIFICPADTCRFYLEFILQMLFTHEHV